MFEGVGVCVYPRAAMLSIENKLLIYDFHLFNSSNSEASFVQSTVIKRFLKDHLNPVMLVFIG